MYEYGVRGILDYMLSVADPGVWVITIILLVVTFGTTIFSYNSSKKQAIEKYKECTMGVWAEVLSVRQKTETKTRRVKTKNGYKTKKYTVTYYIPTLRFDYNFETIEKECHKTNQSFSKYVVGEQVKIYIDPKNIDNMRYEDIPLKELLKRYKKKFMGVMVFLIIFWCFFEFILFGGI